MERASWPSLCDAWDAASLVYALRRDERKVISIPHVVVPVEPIYSQEALKSVGGAIRPHSNHRGLSHFPAPSVSLTRQDIASASPGRGSSSSSKTSARSCRRPSLSV